MSSLIDEIPKLPVADKLAIMEALWSDLHGAMEASSPPDWHREVLDERMRLIQSGEAVYEEWDRVKQELRSRIA
jgi:hypothetical protein